MIEDVCGRLGAFSFKRLCTVLIRATETCLNQLDNSIAPSRRVLAAKWYENC